MRHLLALLIACACSSPIPASAQAPLDTLARSQASPGTYTYTVALQYIPLGRSVDVGSLLSFRELGQVMRFSLAGSYTLTERFAIHVSVGSAQSTVQMEPLGGPFAPSASMLTDSSTLASLSMSYRMAPGSGWDPRIAVSAIYPWGWGVQVSASFLRDPVVLVGALGYVRALDRYDEGVRLTLGIGFVANETLSFTLTTAQFLPIAGSGLPETNFTLQAIYGLDPEGRRDIALVNTLRLRGGEMQAGVGVMWTSRGP